MYSSSSSGQPYTSYATNGHGDANGAGPSSPGKHHRVSASSSGAMIGSSSSQHRNGHASAASSSSSEFQPIYAGSQIDRQELVRLALQCLQDAGYDQAVAALSKESGYTLESPTITTFRNGVLDGKWETVMRLLKDEEIVRGETLKVDQTHSLSVTDLD